VRLTARRGEPTGTELPNGYVRVFGPIYLGVLAVPWVTALPAYFGATNGVTDDGTPVGNLPYAAVSFALASLAVLTVATEKTPDSVVEEGLALQI